MSFPKSRLFTTEAADRNWYLLEVEFSSPRENITVGDTQKLLILQEQTEWLLLKEVSATAIYKRQKKRWFKPIEFLLIETTRAGAAMRLEIEESKNTEK